MQQLPVPRKPTKRAAILDAALEIAVERGLGQTSMALLAARSGASTGVIYHHFTGKEAILQALYERVVSLELACMLDGFSPDRDPREAFLAGWDMLYSFYRRHPREIRFLEQYKSQHGSDGPPGVPEPYAARLAAFRRYFSGRSDGGVLQDWPPSVLEELTVGSLARLARQPQELPPVLLRGIAEKIWDAVKG